MLRYRHGEGGSGRFEWKAGDVKASSAILWQYSTKLSLHTTATRQVVIVPTPAVPPGPTTARRRAEC